MNFDWPAFASDFGYSPDAAGIAALQEAYALPVTGELDQMTLRVLTMTRRCGVSDAPQQVGAQMLKWGITNLRWFVKNYPTGLGLTKADVRQCLRESWDGWQRHIGLTFEEVASEADANVIYQVGRGPRAQFDGRGGVLAYAYFPRSANYSGKSDCWFDGDEPWTNRPETNGILLALTAMHENGHVLGLDHDTRNGGQLMGPTYNPLITAPQQFDIQRAQSLYGKATAPPPTAPTPQPPAGGVPVVKVQWTDGSVWGAELRPLPRT